MNIEETKAAIAVMQAYVDGKEIELLLHNGAYGVPTEFPFWNWSKYGLNSYRVRVTKPSINWDHVAPEYNYLAVDAGGKPYLHEKKPYADCGAPHDGTGAWVSRGGLAYCRQFASYTPGTCDWKDSLVVRPGYESETK